ncbi:hypothetical protein PN36_30260 [Candidatus Thiomargarita nelsonii]|uniref:Uncharacterized protein n=1 Tax=Candidatus Thiomargarita nelsonii TaxID=1003181 RepID=A0A0A6RP43_9GAMM|nr:hypothetical protein PN36_30260 [Candidatus Thiomargarita nelsonii]
MKKDKAPATIVIVMRPLSMYSRVMAIALLKVSAWTGKREMRFWCHGGVGISTSMTVMVWR